MLGTLSRASLASLVATAAELAALPVLIRVAGLPHVIAFASVQLLANLVTFVLYKYWAFEDPHGSWRAQYARQLVVFAGSWALNTTIPTVLAARLHVTPELAFVLSNLVVYLAWNYPGNRYWVFRASGSR